jgi:prepilin-type N-terminal cleavage/methylation domain-containing protein
MKRPVAQVKNGPGQGMLPRLRRDAFGFTLLELLVVVALLGALTLLVSQITGSASSTVASSTKHMESEAEARRVFDRIASDLGRRVSANGADCILSKARLNDALYFYSEAPSYYADATTIGRRARNSVALIGYRIHTNNPNSPGSPVLERLAKGLTWDGTADDDSPGSPVFLTNPRGSALPDPASTIAGVWGASVGSAASGFTNGTDTDYEILSDQVFRMELLFLLKDGSFSAVPAGNPATTTNNLAATSPPAASDDASHGYAKDSRWFDKSPGGAAYLCLSATPGAAVWTRLGFRDVSALVIGLAILDPQSRKTLSDTSLMPAGLPDPNPAIVPGAASASPPQPPQLLSTQWLSSLRDLDTFSTASGIPRSAAGQVRIYQRTFFLNN